MTSDAWPLGANPRPSRAAAATVAVGQPPAQPMPQAQVGHAPAAGRGRSLPRIDASRGSREAVVVVTWQTRHRRQRSTARPAVKNSPPWLISASVHMSLLIDSRLWWIGLAWVRTPLNRRQISRSPLGEELELETGSISARRSQKIRSSRS